MKFLHLCASLMLTLVISSGCAWNPKDVSTWFKADKEVDDSQLVQIGVDQQDVDKFSIQEVTPAPVADASQASVTKPSRPVVKTPVKTKTEAKPKSKPVVSAVVKSLYPEDYPQELKELDYKTKATWEQFKPYLNKDEKIMLDVDYLGMTVGKVVVGYRGLKM
ncbi:MAG: hypothetical protein LW878_12840, partial [Proteobacteria bacterium]|nr:hypothetical protein [Pseudomonadota bacterium]